MHHLCFGMLSGRATRLLDDVGQFLLGIGSGDRSRQCGRLSGYRGREFFPHPVRFAVDVAASSGGGDISGARKSLVAGEEGAGGRCEESTVSIDVKCLMVFPDVYRFAQSSSHLAKSRKRFRCR